MFGEFGIVLSKLSKNAEVRATFEVFEGLSLESVSREAEFAGSVFKSE